MKTHTHTHTYSFGLLNADYCTTIRIGDATNFRNIKEQLVPKLSFVYLLSVRLHEKTLSKQISTLGFYIPIADNNNTHVFFLQRAKRGHNTKRGHTEIHKFKS